ncbi:MAG: hypothetical protein LBM77_04220 [Spirochaetaceae bacterium]|jgi:hypothetical protein|nr:hypothetical protein [Spirochaetaceae bacterium]
MKRFLACAIFTLLAISQASAYPILYKEQFYKLYHQHYNAAPDDIMENIYWLEKAINADFCNPLYALATITTTEEWEKYRNLFNMHLYLKMTDQHIALGNGYNKFAAYFYNAPWKEQNLDSLKTAENCYNMALYYWNLALEASKKAQDPKFRWLNLDNAHYWQEEATQIETGKLNYGRTIKRQLQQIADVRAAFQNMDKNTY